MSTRRTKPDVAVALTPAPRGYAAWCDGVIARASADLRGEFPKMAGFSTSNLEYMQRFAETWPTLGAIGQQPVDQLPRGHNLVRLVKTRSRVFAEYALRDTKRPMGIAEYRLKKTRPKKLEVSLPSIDQIEAELAEPRSAPTAVKRTKRASR